MCERKERGYGERYEKEGEKIALKRPANAENERR